MKQTIYLLEKEVRTFEQQEDGTYTLYKTYLGSTACSELETAKRFMHNNSDCFHTTEPTLHYDSKDDENLYLVYDATRTNEKGQRQDFEWRIYKSILF